MEESIRDYHEFIGRDVEPKFSKFVCHANQVNRMGDSSGGIGSD